jgi:serine protease SohB
MRKLGIERRVYTSGERKVMLDPFLPEKPEDVERIHALQKDIHAHFIALVKSRRGAKLSGSDETLFSGEFWAAERAIALGLADRIGDLRSEMRKRYGEKVKLPLIEGERSWIGRSLPGVLSGAGIDASPEALISAIEARALWARFGL